MFWLNLHINIIHNLLQCCDLLHDLSVLCVVKVYGWPFTPNFSSISVILTEIQPNLNLLKSLHCGSPHDLDWSKVKQLKMLIQLRSENFNAICFVIHKIFWWRYIQMNTQLHINRHEQEWYHFIWPLAFGNKKDGWSWEKFPKILLQSAHTGLI